MISYPFNFIFMKAKLLAAILCSFSVHAFAQNYITVYADCNYRGTSQQLTAGRYSLSTTGIGARNLSSMRVPEGFRVVLYAAADPGTGYEKITFTTDISCLSNSGWNDRAGSLVIERNNQVFLFSDCYFGGNSQSFGTGKYNYHQLGPIGNDQLSSLRIPSGWTVTVYADANYLGASETYSSDIDCLNSVYNDKVSSMWIRNGSGNNNGNGNNGNNNGNNNNGNAAIAYSDCYFRGESQPFYAGRYNVSDLATKVGNDAISSIQLPRNWSVTVYDDVDFGGRSETFNGSLNCLGRDWNDKISSMIISNRPVYNNNNNNNNNYSQVVLYSDCSFAGTSQVFNSGSFNVYQLGAIGNDQLSSIKIPNGWTVTLYEEKNYRGRSKVYYSDISCLPGDWNDKVSSLRVQRN